jgi:hypothetical protein
VPDFTRIIDLAYQKILDRPPDPGGLDSYNRAMNAGLSEADLRESLIRSAEYASKHPARLAVPAGRSQGAEKAGKKKRTSKTKTSTDRGRTKSTRKSR